MTKINKPSDGVFILEGKVKEKKKKERENQ